MKIENLKEKQRPDLDNPYIAPRNGIEKIIAENWQEALGYEKIGENDNFFELGGHSLIAAAIATKLIDVFDLRIPLSQLFEIPTISDLAELIASVIVLEGNKIGINVNIENFEEGII
jgi:phthiocerol/phenolphthiocerol synthesis type-I polyketide synthase E